MLGERICIRDVLEQEAPGGLRRRFQAIELDIFATKVGANANDIALVRCDDDQRIALEEIGDRRERAPPGAPHLDGPGEIVATLESEAEDHMSHLRPSPVRHEEVERCEASPDRIPGRPMLDCRRCPLCHSKSRTFVERQRIPVAIPSPDAPHPAPSRRSGGGSIVLHQVAVAASPKTKTIAMRLPIHPNSERMAASPSAMQAAAAKALRLAGKGSRYQRARATQAVASTATATPAALLVANRNRWVRCRLMVATVRSGTDTHKGAPTKKPERGSDLRDPASQASDPHGLRRLGGRPKRRRGCRRAANGAVSIALRPARAL